MSWQTADEIQMPVPPLESASAATGAARRAPGRDARASAQDTGLSIGEVCRRTALSARTVRYYEELGLLPGVRRRAGGRRVYGPDELQRLQFIGRLKTLGLSLGEIKELNALYAHEGSTHDMLQRLHALLGDHLGELDQRIASLGQLREEMSAYRAHVARRLADEADEVAAESEPAPAARPEDEA